MTKQHYVIYLDNYALPGICSGVKDYFGTIEEMKEFILALKKDGHFSKTVEAFDKYLAGDTKAMHYACYTQQLLMNRAKCLATRNQYVESKKWEFLNTFGFPYTMSFESVGVRIALLSYQGKFCRAIRVRFKNLAYMNETIDTAMEILDGEMLWGHPGIYQVEEKDGAIYMTSRLYFPEKYYKTKEEALSDFNSDICFDVCCQDVFGDG